jgi:hypothetical protein
MPDQCPVCGVAMQTSKYPSFGTRCVCGHWIHNLRAHFLVVAFLCLGSFVLLVTVVALVYHLPQQALVRNIILTAAFLFVPPIMSILAAKRPWESLLARTLPWLAFGARTPGLSCSWESSGTCGGWRNSRECVWFAKIKPNHRRATACCDYPSSS